MFKHYYLNVLRQGALAAAVAVGAASCGSDDGDTNNVTPPGNVDNVDPATVPTRLPSPNGGESGFDDTINQQLAALADSQCVWTPGSGGATGLLTITLNAGQQVVVGRNGVNVVVNNVTCPSNVDPLTPITDTSLKTLTINGSTGNETVVLDYAAGLFGMGTTTAAHGTNLDLKTGTGDQVMIRMTSGVDTVVCGGAGTANHCNVDATVANTFADLKNFTGVESVAFGLGGGADIFWGHGTGASAPTGTGTFGATAFGIQLMIHGGDANDTITAGRGNDTVYGGAGVDVISGETTAANGKDYYSGGGDAGDHLTYAVRVATEDISILPRAPGAGIAVSGRQASGSIVLEEDTILNDFTIYTGGLGNDTLEGVTGANTLNGGPGNDSLLAGGGDTLNGDAGNDTFLQGATKTDGDIIAGGDGIDTVSFAARTEAVKGILVNLGAAANSATQGERDDIGGAPHADDEEDQIGTCENVITGPGPDTITGNGSNNVLTGGLGVDTIAGGAGDDTIDGGGGADNLSGDGGNDLFIEGTLTSVTSGNDSINGGTEEDTVSFDGRTGTGTGGFTGVTVNLSAGPPGTAVQDTETNTLDGIERVIGSAFPDSITCAATYCKVEGGAGADTIIGGNGDDQLEGGAGQDSYNCGGGNDVVVDAEQTATHASCEIWLTNPA